MQPITVTSSSIWWRRSLYRRRTNHSDSNQPSTGGEYLHSPNHPPNKHISTKPNYNQSWQLHETRKHKQNWPWQGCHGRRWAKRWWWPALSPLALLASCPPLDKSGATPPRPPPCEFKDGPSQHWSLKKSFRFRWSSKKPRLYDRGKAIQQMVVTASAPRQIWHYHLLSRLDNNNNSNRLLIVSYVIRAQSSN